MSIKKKFETVNDTSEWFQWSKSLLDLYETEKQFLVNYKNHRLSFLSMRKWILGHSFEGVDAIMQKLLLDSMLSANKSPGSEIYVPWFLYNSLEVEIPYRASSEVYLEATLSKTKQEFTRSVFRAIYDQVGPLTKIIVKPSAEIDVVIKSRNSFKFPLKLDHQFQRIIGHTEFIELANPVIIMIEGAPETIGEINSLLEKNHETGRPIVLIARSFPEEISATLAANWLKSTLSVLPMVYGNELETINLAADMCTITDGELISAHFGDVISVATMDKDKWGTVDKIEWTPYGLSIYKTADTSRHIQNLLNKIKNTENKELEELLQERILSLSNDAIEVWIPRDETQLLEELDSLIKHYNAFVSAGCVETPLGLVPKPFVEAAQESAKSLKEEIVNIGGFLVRVDDEVVA